MWVVVSNRVPLRNVKHFVFLCSVFHNAVYRAELMLVMFQGRGVERKKIEPDSLLCGVITE